MPYTYSIGYKFTSGRMKEEEDKSCQNLTDLQLLSFYRSESQAGVSLV